MPEATPAVRPATGRPTVAEAVSFLLKNDQLTYRRACLQDWRERYGDAFASEVEERVRAAWKAKR